MSFRSQFISDYVVRNVQIRGQTSISVQRAILRNYKKIKISYLIIFQPIWEVAKELQDIQTYQESNTKDTDNIFNMIILHLPQTFKTFKQEKKKKKDLFCFLFQENSMVVFLILILVWFFFGTEVYPGKLTTSCNLIKHD